jgi:hypothetical protein
MAIVAERLPASLAADVSEPIWNVSLEFGARSYPAVASDRVLGNGGRKPGAGALLRRPTTQDLVDDGARECIA